MLLLSELVIFSCHGDIRALIDMLVQLVVLCMGSFAEFCSEL